MELNLPRDDIGTVVTFDSEFDRFLRPTPRNVTIKFTTDDETVFTQAFIERSTIGEIKTFLVDVFGVPGSVIDLRQDDNSLEDELTLESFKPRAYERLEFDLYSKSSRYEISASKAYEDLVHPDIITVRVETPDGDVKDVVVEIEDRSIVKPCLGGYVSTTNGIEYQHAYSQTGPPKPKIPPEMKATRDTQTYLYKNRLLNTRYSRATQMTNEKTWIPNVNDIIYKSGPYETAEERERRLDIPGKVRTIQRYFWAWKLRKALKILCEEYRKRVRIEQETDERDSKEDLERKKRELIAKVFPRSRSDFAMLYTMVERWKKAEIERISTIACGPAKIANFYMLLDKEIEMLRAIEKQREIVKRDMQIQRDVDFLKYIGTPLFWHSKYKDIPVWMDTLETQQGRVFEQLYLNICKRSSDRDEQIKALVELKLFFEGHECTIWSDLRKLIERVCVLIARGIHPNHLDVLHKRIEALLLRHFRQAECNGGVTNHMVRVKEKLMEDNLFYCNRCQKLKTHDLFTLNSRVTKLNVCLLCSWYDRVIEPWIDLEPYRFMLRRIRREERIKNSCSSLAFIMQDVDIHLIVTQIWHSHSAINENDNIYNLRLCRWFKDEDWAPWNCILLTKEEAKSHLNIRKLQDVYDKEFFRHVFNKHTLAKRMFKVAAKLEDRLQQIGNVDTRWNEVMDVIEFVAVNSKPKIFISCH